jgi:hypothetical protein
MTYNLTINNFNDFLQYPNIVTGNWFWTFVIIAQFMIIFVVTKNNYLTERSFAVASFLCFLSAIILYAMSFITMFVLIITMVATIFGLISLKISGSKDF